MPRRLVVNAGDRPLPVLLADATRLPAAPSSFGGVLASRVLHLIPGWRVAVDEAVRVLRPGGVLLADFGGRGEPRTPARARPTAARPPWRRPVRELLRRHGITQDRGWVTTADAVTRYLRGRVSARPLPPVTMTVRRTLRRTVADMERQIFSWTWPYAPEQVRDACADIRAWAASENVPLDAESEVGRVIQWWAFDLAAPASAGPGSP
jgi:SAM-dependent methyltransferase